MLCNIVLNGINHLLIVCMLVLMDIKHCCSCRLHALIARVSADDSVLCVQEQNRQIFFLPMASLSSAIYGVPWMAILLILIGCFR